MRSESVDLPWSTWLMMEKLRMRSMATGPLAETGDGTVRRSYRAPPRATTAPSNPVPRGARPNWGRDLLGLLSAPVGCGLSRHPPRIPFESIEDFHVANIASQIKRNRQNEKLRLRNKSVRAELRTRTKNAVTAAAVGAEDSVEQLRLAVKRIDKAAARGVIHKNTAANHKSRLVRRVAALEAATLEVDEEQ